jgi:hypothetical protein
MTDTFLRPLINLTQFPDATQLRQDAIPVDRRVDRNIPRELPGIRTTQIHQWVGVEGEPLLSSLPLSHWWRACGWSLDSFEEYRRSVPSVDRVVHGLYHVKRTQDIRGAQDVFLSDPMIKGSGFYLAIHPELVQRHWDNFDRNMFF